MNDNLALFLTLVIGMSLVAGIILTWIKSHAATKTASVGLNSTRQVELLSNENAGLKGQVSRLEERISVLERIATDPAERTARAIDQLK